VDGVFERSRRLRESPRRRGTDGQPAWAQQLHRGTRRARSAPILRRSSARGGGRQDCRRACQVGSRWRRRRCSVGRAARVSQHTFVAIRYIQLGARLRGETAEPRQARSILLGRVVSIVQRRGSDSSVVQGRRCAPSAARTHLAPPWRHECDERPVHASGSPLGRHRTGPHSSRRGGKCPRPSAQRSHRRE